MDAVALIGISAFVILIGVCIVLFWRLKRVEDNVRVVMEQLATVSPTIERRLAKQGTQVVLSEKWLDEFDAETSAAADFSSTK